jgi:hypothetical protein
MAYRNQPRYQARVQQRARREETRTTTASAAQPQREREVAGGVQPRGDRWNTAPVLDPLVELYRR